MKEYKNIILFNNNGGSKPRGIPASPYAILESLHTP